MTTRLLIVADNALAAESIRRALRHTPECHLLGFVTFLRVDAIPTGDTAPHVVLVDEHPRAGDIRVYGPAIRRSAPEAKLVLLARSVELGDLEQAAAAGMDAVIARSVQPGALGPLIREIAAGKVFHPAGRTVALAEPAAPRVPLTARELEILRLVAAGTSNARIATGLWVTEQTVKFHLSNVYRKLGVTNRTQASHYAHVHGLVAQNPIATPALADAEAA